MKANSSKWMVDNGAEDFQWQIGYGAFTVSFSMIDQVAEYIRKQKEHHRARSFQEEYVAILKKHGIEFDAKYLFEGEHCG